jgi:hypothetical protein
MPQSSPISSIAPATRLETARRRARAALIHTPASVTATQPPGASSRRHATRVHDGTSRPRRRLPRSARKAGRDAPAFARVRAPEWRSRARPLRTSRSSGRHATRGEMPAAPFNSGACSPAASTACTGRQASASAPSACPFRDGASALCPASTFASSSEMQPVLGLQPVAVPAETQGAQVVARLADQVAFMGTSP